MRKILVGSLGSTNAVCKKAGGAEGAVSSNGAGFGGSSDHGSCGAGAGGGGGGWAGAKARMYPKNRGKKVPTPPFLK